MFRKALVVGLLFLSSCATVQNDLCITARRGGSKDTPIVLVRLENGVEKVSKRPVTKSHQFILCEAIRSSFTMLFPDAEFRCQMIERK